MTLIFYLPENLQRVGVVGIVLVNRYLKQTLIHHRATVLKIINITISMPYLIFVIFFTQAKLLENKIYTEKRVNYDKLHSKLPILRVYYDKLHSRLPIFRVKSVKNYSGKKKFTRPPPVAPVTNMRYGMVWQGLISVPVTCRVKLFSLIKSGIYNTRPNHKSQYLIHMDTKRDEVLALTNNLGRSSY